MGDARLTSHLLRGAGFGDAPLMGLNKRPIRDPARRDPAAIGLLETHPLESPLDNR